MNEFSIVQITKSATATIRQSDIMHGIIFRITENIPLDSGKKEAGLPRTCTSIEVEKRQAAGMNDDCSDRSKADEGTRL